MLALLFDPCSGASGDMIMGCLLDLGADENAVCEAVQSVGCSLEISMEERGHILARRARVISEKRYQSLSEAESILRGSSLRGEALKSALSALDILACAEGRVHGLPREQAMFHEIGALDALADIAGSCAALQSLGVSRVLSLPVSAGSGYVSSAHGLLPVPGPAALEILRSCAIPWKGGPVEAELLTPTGAALLGALVDEFLPGFPRIRVERVGYGAGTRELPLPNVLRAVMAETLPEPPEESEHIRGPHGDHVVQLETNVDDVTGEVMGYLVDLLMDGGALDVSVLPALMKKGRSGNVIRAIARQEEADGLAKTMMRETGSLGVRVFHSIHRYVAERESRTVELVVEGRSFQAGVKVSRLQGDLLRVKPEYEDCKKIARETGLPLCTVMRRVEEVGWRAGASGSQV